MGFNYSTERKKFEREWKKIREEYLEAGMSESSIMQLYQFDLAAFYSNRRYIMHTQSLPDLNDPERIEKSGRLYQKFQNLSYTVDENSLSGHYAWIDTIDSPTILRRLRRLNSKDVEVLTLYAIDGFNQQEIAQIIGCHQTVISRRIKKIKKILRG